MIRTFIIPCKLPRAEADALNQASGHVYTRTMVAHYRVYRKKRRWLSPYTGRRLCDHLTRDERPLLHAHSKDAAQEAFYTACKTAKANCGDGAKYPHKRKLWRTTIWRVSAIRDRGNHLLLSQAKGLPRIRVCLPDDLPSPAARDIREVRLVWDRVFRRYTWHLVMEAGIPPKPAPGANTAAVLETLFPGLGRELSALGAHQIDISADFLLFSAFGCMPRTPAHITTYISSRELLEWQVRQRVLADTDAITVRQEHAVIGIDSDADGRITGVQLRRHGDPAGTATPVRLAADLVVDASGRQSQTPEWLVSLGYPPVEITTINSFVGYASRYYACPPDRTFDWKTLTILSRPPGITRLGTILPLEGNRWIVTLAGAARDYPPMDDAGFLDFARSLSTPLLYEAIKDAQPLSPIVGYRQTENRLVHYERLSRWPERFVVVGDAVCAFNPIYGQGMANAGINALVLDQALARHRRKHPDGQLDGLARPFQRRLASVNDAAWLLATSEDFRYPLTEGGNRTWLTRQLHGYLDQVIALSSTRPAIYRTLLAVLHLLKPPVALFHPRITAAVGRRLLSGESRKARIEQQRLSNV